MRTPPSRPYDSDYRKALYRKSARARLGFINCSRRQKGLPEIDSLEGVKLRVPLDSRQ